jgi:signal transduction histidine kinase
MKQPTVLIISDEADFSRTVVNRWQTERSLPAFTVVSSGVSDGAGKAAYDVAIVGGVRAEVMLSTLKTLDAGTRPVIAVLKDTGLLKTVRESYPRVLSLRDYLGWVDALLLVATESLRRIEAVERACKAEAQAASNEAAATLGRYMLEMRHTLNNALTSVLGNAELLLLEPGAFTAEVRDQLDTIHTMALRIHEVVQRMSSLETELSFAEKRSQTETSLRMQARSSGV